MRLFEDFIDTLDREEVVTQDKSIDNSDNFMFMFMMQLGYEPNHDNLEVTLRRNARRLEAMLRQTREVSVFSPVVYFTASEIYPKCDTIEVVPNDVTKEDFLRYHANRSWLKMRFLADCRFKSIDNAMRFIINIQNLFKIKYEKYLRYVSVFDIKTKKSYPVRYIDEVVEGIGKRRTAAQQNSYAFHVAIMSDGLMRIMDIPYPVFHDRLYEMTGVNIAQKMMNNAFTRFINEQSNQSRKNITLNKNFKNMFIGTPVNPDILEENMKGVHSAKWLVYTANTTILNILGEIGSNLIKDSSTTLHAIKELIKQNKLIIKDVSLKTYNANLDWAFVIYTTPVYNDYHDFWNEVVLIGDCQISYDEIDATCNKLFSDNLLKNNEFQDYIQELIEKLFSIVNDED